MKVHRIRQIVIAFAVGSALTSCSNSAEPDESNGSIDGVQSEENGGEESSPAPEDTATEDGIDRPEINLPESMENIFEDTETGETDKDEIIGDVVHGINAVDMAVSLSDPQNEAVEFYHSLDGLDNVQNYIRAAAESGEAGRTWQGTVDYYNFSVDNEDDRSRQPIVSYCSDRSEAETVELATGEVLTGEEYAGGQVQIQVVVEQNDLGVWQVIRVLPQDEAGDELCRR
jgi:hypothetical protein